MSNEPSRRVPLNDRVSEDVIRDLVHAFYAKVRADEELGPIFSSVIKGDWDPHLRKMCDFWSSVMRMTGRYDGNPMGAHIRLTSVKPEHFARWITLFEQTAREVCDAGVAALFVARAANIARSLQLGMFYRPADRPALASR